MSLTDAQREAIYRLRFRKPIANGLFKHLAGLKHKMKETSVSVVEKSSGLNRQLSLARRQKADCALSPELLKLDPAGYDFAHA